MTQGTDDQDRQAGQTPASSRTPRALSGPVLTFDLAKEADRLRGEGPWSQHGRNAVTLVKHSDLRIVFILMKATARLQEHHAGARISVHTLAGHVRLHLNEGTVDLPAGHLLALESDIPHDLEAVEESAVLLTIAWRGE
jgi:quercetin dioxygenase-like cupin family protein